MTPSMLIALFITLYLINFLWDLYLSRLNIQHQLKYPTAPQPFDAYIEAEKYQQTQQYSRSYYRFNLVSGIVSTTMFLLFVYSGLMNALDGFLHAHITGEIMRGICFFLILFALSFLMGIPFSLYATFVIEEKFGFNRETPSLWLQDKLKEILLSLALLFPLSYAVLYFMTSVGEYWWVYAWAVFLLYNLILVQIYPIFIAPLFNKFTPLEEGELRTQLENLANTAQFPLQNIYIMDETKRSTHSNAYFAGFGKTKRLVLYDTLRKDFTTEEIMAVVAHEIGHYKKKHILKHMIVSQIAALLFFYILHLAFTHPYLYQTFLIERTSSYMGLILLSFVTSLVLSFFSPLFNRLSWKYESEADQYSFDLLSKKEALKTMLIKLAVKNLSNLTPHPLYARFNYSHPPIKERLEKLGLLDSSPAPSV